MGIIIVGFFLIYILVFVALFLIAGFGFKRWKIGLLILGFGIIFPFVDAYMPTLAFEHFCSKNLKFIYKGPIKDVEGFYSESIEGVCRHCTAQSFLDGYKYIEGRINKKSALTKSIDQKIDDVHRSLYRFTLVSIDVDKDSFRCDQPNIAYLHSVSKWREVLKTYYLCIKPTKISKIQASFSHSDKIIPRRNEYFGIVTGRERVIYKQNGNPVLDFNYFQLLPKTFLGVNALFLGKQGCNIPNKVGGRRIKEILIPKALRKKY